MPSLWDKCLNYLRDEIPPQQYNTWIRPLHAVESKQNGLLLLAPNRFVLDWINERFLSRITELLSELCDEVPPPIKLQIGSKSTEIDTTKPRALLADSMNSMQTGLRFGAASQHSHSNINPSFTFESFV